MTTDVQVSEVTIPNTIDTGAKLKSAIQQIGARITDSNVLSGLFTQLIELVIGIVSNAFTEYSPLTGISVVANKTGITAAWDTGVLTVTLPANTILQTLRVSMLDATNIQAESDGSVTNWIRIKIVGTTGKNTDRTTLHIPIVQKTVYTAGAPSLSNVFPIDLDNTPAVGIVEVTGNSVTIRISGITTATNGSQFVITSI